MKLFEIFGEIGLKGAEAVDSALTQLSDAGKTTSETLANVGDRMTSAGDKMSAWITGPIVAVTAALGAVGKKAIDAGSALVDTATRTGMTVEAFQELSFAISQITGASEGEITSAFQRINQRVGAAAQGNKNYTASLKELGFSQSQIAAGTLKSDEVFAALSRRLQNTKSDAEAAAIAGAFLGNKLGQTLAPALRAGGAEVDNLRQKFRDLGLGMSNESAAAAEGLGDKLDVLERQFQALLIPIGTALLPLLEQLISMAQTSLIPALQTVVGVVGSLVAAFTSLPTPLQEAVIGFIALSAAIGPSMSILGRLLALFGSAPAVVGGVATVLSRLAPIVLSVGSGLVALTGAVLPLMPVLAALTAAVVAGIAIYENWDAIVAAVTETYNTLKNKVVDISSAVARTIGEWAKTVINFYVSLWSGIIESVVNFGKSVVTGIQNMATNAWAVLKGWGENVLNFFKSLPQAVAAYINNMVQNVINSVVRMAQQTIAAIQNMYRQVVGNSIVPDMVDDVGAEMQRMTKEGVAEAQAFDEGVQRALENTHAASQPAATVNGGGNTPASGNGANGGGNTYVDMRHAVIRDDRDMTDRLMRNGEILAGAF